MKFEVYLTTKCQVFDIVAKDEETAKKKALQMMVKEMKKEGTVEAVCNLETTFVVDSDDYYEIYYSEPSINGVKSLNFRSKE